jgi:hypothetical protein
MEGNSYEDMSESEKIDKVKDLIASYEADPKIKEDKNDDDEDDMDLEFTNIYDGGTTFTSL